MLALIFNSALRIDIGIELLFILVSLYGLITKKNNLSFINSLLVFTTFIVLHTIYSFINFAHIFNTVITVNFQLLLIIFLIIFYELYPLTIVQIRKAVIALNIFGIIILFFQFLSFIGISVISTQGISNGSTRYFGIIGDQEAWLFSLFSFINFRRKSYFISILFLIGLLLTGSIGAIFIFIIALLFNYYLDFSRTFRLIYVGSFILMVPLLFKIAPYINLPFVNRLFDNALTDGGPLAHRTAALENALSEVLKKLVLGFGNFAGEMIYQYDDTLSIYEKGKLTYLATSNNQIFDIVLSYGFVGLIFFLFFIIATLKCIKPIKPNLYYHKYFEYTSLFYLWFFIFLFFNQSSIWFIPGSYIFLILALLISISSSFKKYLTKQDITYNNIYK